MPKVTITRPFKYAHGGHTVQEFLAGHEPIETTDEVAQWATTNGYATDSTHGDAEPSKAESAPPSNKALSAAPENKDLGKSALRGRKGQ